MIVELALAALLAGGATVAVALGKRGPRLPSKEKPPQGRPTPTQEGMVKGPALFNMAAASKVKARPRRTFSAAAKAPSFKLSAFLSHDPNDYPAPYRWRDVELVAGHVFMWMMGQGAPEAQELEGRLRRRFKAIQGAEAMPWEKAYSTMVLVILPALDGSAGFRWYHADQVDSTARILAYQATHPNWKNEPPQAHSAAEDAERHERKRAEVAAVAFWLAGFWLGPATGTKARDGWTYQTTMPKLGKPPWERVWTDAMLEPGPEESPGYRDRLIVGGRRGLTAEERVDELGRISNKLFQRVLHRTEKGGSFYAAWWKAMTPTDLPPSAGVERRAAFLLNHVSRMAVAAHDMSIQVNAPDAVRWGAAVVAMVLSLALSAAAPVLAPAMAASLAAASAVIVAALETAGFAAASALTLAALAVSLLQAAIGAAMAAVLADVGYAFDPALSAEASEVGTSIGLVIGENA